MNNTQSVSAAEEIKRHERQAYDACAGHYSRVWTTYTHGIAGALVRLVGAQPGDTGLDVTAGTGAAGIRLAQHVGPQGRVVITDLSPGMIEQAKANVADYGLDNATCQVMDAEALDLPDGTFDRVISTFGVMFLPDIRKGMREAFRVLRPGGTIGLAVWSTLDQVPFIGYPMLAVLRQLAPAPVRLLLRAPGLRERMQRKVLRKDRPHGFTPGRFGEPGELEAAMTAAGFQSVQRVRGNFPLVFEHPQHFLDATFQGSPAKAMLEGLPPRAARKVVRDMWRLMGVQRGPLVLNNEACLLYGVKPVS
jgi:ubiquinone/menaquinone biosynthesis C-methylase UbiE